MFSRSNGFRDSQFNAAVLLALWSSGVAFAETHTDNRAALAQPRVFFEANIGQFAEDSSFVARGSDRFVVFRPGEMAVQWHAGSEKSPVVLSFEGGSQSVEPVGDSLVPGRRHYFLGQESDRWFRNVPWYRNVR